MFLFLLIRWRMLRFLLAVTLCVSSLALVSNAAEFEVKESPEKVEVTYGGKLVTNYWVKSGTKPVLWPIVGPTGKEMTRAYPLREKSAAETSDHIHHRSLWFTYGDVNGVSYWHEEGKEKPGLIVHKAFTKVSGGDKAIIAAKNDWVDPHGKKACEEERQVTIFMQNEALCMDFTIVMKATEGELVFGDTKEGAFGVRVPTSMDVKAKKGGKIMTSEGVTNTAAWGTKAAWVDYSGPVENETLGIAILNHPTSYRFPTRWHVRDYGLFAANPFGEKDFPGGKKEEGTHKFAKNATLTLKYRVIFHKGDETAANIAAAFEAYKQEK
jgi:Methane oxygenase PmoA